jgi:thiamine biosynthesis protein ThiS
MRIIVNGKPAEVKDKITVAEFLEEQKINPKIVAVEVNDSILEPERYSQKLLKDNDRLEIIFYLGGGRC